MGILSRPIAFVTLALAALVHVASVDAQAPRVLPLLERGVLDGQSDEADEAAVDDDVGGADEPWDDDDGVDSDEVDGEAGSDGDDDDLSADDEERLLRVHVDLAAGLAFREVEWPIEGGTGSLSLGPSAALDVAVGAAYTPTGAFSLGLQLRYQTTVGARVDEQQIAGVERPMGIRGARFEALLVPALDVSELIRLGLAVGYGLRGLRSHVHDQQSPTVHDLRTPDYTLAGPVARLLLQLSFGEVVAVVLEPEAQLLVAVGSELERRGASAGGLAFGGQASLVVGLGELLSVLLQYRESHASIAGQTGRADVSDVERYITAGLRGSL